ncbi:MAG TPA: hypothetical protein VG796_23500 [Verrucomicrobiales bacterium]|nr:hypothetical protein [Verrucomicrobiales bacterium]
MVLLQGEAVMDNDPAKETRMLGRVLSLLKLPLQPWAAFGETIEVFERLCPRLMWGLTPRGEGKPNAPGLWNRTLLALRNGLYIEVRFWQDRLDDIIVLDVDLWFLNTDVTAWEEAWEAAARENKLADFYASLLPIFMDNSVSAKPSTIEWSRGFGPPGLKRPCRPESLQGLNGGDFKASSVNNG